MSITLPADVVDLLLDVLRRRYPEHQRAFESDRSLTIGTLEPVEFHRLKEPGARDRAEQPAPCVLVGPVQPIEKVIDDEGAVAIEWQFIAEVYVEGVDQADTIDRRDITMMLLAECLEGRVPRDGILTRVEVVDIAVGDRSADESGIEAIAVLDLAIDVPDAYRIDRFPVDDSPIEPGTPGGPPEEMRAPVPPAELRELDEQIDT